MTLNNEQGIEQLMDDINFSTEFGRALVAAIAAFLIGLVLTAAGGGKWVVAAGSCAVGGMVGVVAIA
jgi:hypothetical protein